MKGVPYHSLPYSMKNKALSTKYFKFEVVATGKSFVTTSYSTSQQKAKLLVENQYPKATVKCLSED